MADHSRLIKWCAVALFLPLLFPLAIGQVFTRDDLSAFHLPIRFLYSEALKAGDSFLWTSALYSGFFLHGEGQAGMAHPFHLFLYRFFPLSVAFDLEILSGYVAALAGMRIFLGRIGLSREGAWFGALVFAFSGFNLLHLIHVNAIEILSHAPWLLLATHVLLTSPDHRKRAWAFAGVALLLASQLLLGYPQYVWLTWFGVGYLVLCLLLARSTTVSRLALLMTAVAFGVLMGSFQLLATREALMESLRAAPSLEFRMSLSLVPSSLVSLWSPDVFRVFPAHELSIYNGAFSAIALTWLFVRGRAVPHRTLLGALIVLAGVSLLFALGPTGGVYPWISALPGLNTFRAPARYTLLFQLALSIIAAVVFEDLSRLSRRPGTVATRSLWPLGVLVLLTAATVLAPLRSWWRGLTPPDWPGLIVLDPFRSNLALPWPWACLLVLTVVLVVLMVRGKAWCVPALIVVVALDQGLWGYAYAYGINGEYVQRAEDLARREGPPDAVAGDLFFEPLQQGALSRGESRRPPNGGIMRGLRRSTGYVALVPRGSLDSADPITQRIAGVKWRFVDGNWLHVADSMPRARLVTTARVSEDIARDVQLVDVSREVLLNQSVGTLVGEPGSALILSDRPGAITVQTIAPGRQLLVVTERFHRGWRVTEDGSPREVVRVFGDYLGCVVGPGTHRIELTFAPSSVRMGFVATGVGLSLTLFAVVFQLRQRQMPSPKVQA